MKKRALLSLIFFNSILAAAAQGTAQEFLEFIPKDEALFVLARTLESYAFFFNVLALFHSTILIYSFYVIFGPEPKALKRTKKVMIKDIKKAFAKRSTADAPQTAQEAKTLLLAAIQKEETLPSPPPNVVEIIDHYQEGRRIFLEIRDRSNEDVFQAWFEMDSPQIAITYIQKTLGILRRFWRWAKGIFKK